MPAITQDPQVRTGQPHCTIPQLLVMQLPHLGRLTALPQGEKCCKPPPELKSQQGQDPSQLLKGRIASGFLLLTGGRESPTFPSMARSAP